MKVGDRVVMSEAFKARLRGKCGEAGSCLGPFDPENANDCWGCSSAHVKEFGKSVGVIKCAADYNNCKPGDPSYDLGKVGPEWEVAWEPDGLVYHYKDVELVLAGAQNP